MINAPCHPLTEISKLVVYRLFCREIKCGPMTAPSGDGKFPFILERKIMKKMSPKICFINQIFF